MQAKLRRAGRFERARLRRAEIVTVFQIKAARGFRQFLLRGFEYPAANGR